MVETNAGCHFVGQELKFDVGFEIFKISSEFTEKIRFENDRLIMSSGKSRRERD